MAAMIAVEPGALVAFFHRPTTSMLVIAVLVGAAGWAWHVRSTWATRPDHEAPSGDQRPRPLDGRGLEPPAVVALLTNGYDVPNTAVTATALDLAARGWIRLTTVDGELAVVTRGNAGAGDSLLPFEQQVLNHIASRAFNDVISAGTLAVSQHRLDRRWWLRFRRAVASHAASTGLSIRRYTPVEIAPAAVLAAAGLISWWLAGRGGQEVAIADSWQSRTIWVATLALLGGLVWATVLRALGSAQRPTDLGRQRTAAWLGYRSRLRDRIPAHANVLAPPQQQLALAHACTMGVATQVLEQLPAAPEDHRTAWSEAGGTPHVVRVHYPIRPGYGQHPVKIGVAGLIVLLLARWLQGFLRDVGDGEALTSLLERVPGQIDLITDLADVLAVICWLPILWGLWAVVAGAVDSVATRERIGAVVRARRPGEVLPPVLATVVKPFAERDRFSTYLAVDDGRRTWVSAWLANERSAAPQGAQARVRATPLLGYVRSSEPVGTATRTATQTGA
jgi:hypothetical protein